jgi:hypothetical protein
MTQNAPTTEVDAKKVVVSIRVNKKPVQIVGRRASGFEIKQAAIAQEVDIQLDFQLARMLGHDQRKIIGDTDVIELHDGEKFAATAGDDNS